MVMEMGAQADAGIVIGGDDELLLDIGERLVARRGLMDRGESGWLGLLADFDDHQLWSLDGQTTCVAWLCWRLKMGRATAFEKLRVAHELRRRPVLAAAFESGAVGYSAVRAITRLDGPDPAVDEALVAVAISGTVDDLERAVRHYQLCADQDRPPGDLREERRGLRVRWHRDGTATIEITCDELECQELLAALGPLTDRRSPTGPAGGLGGESPGGPGGESPGGDRNQDGDPYDPWVDGSAEPGGESPGGDRNDGGDPYDHEGQTAGTGAESSGGDRNQDGGDPYDPWVDGSGEPGGESSGGERNDGERAEAEGTAEGPAVRAPLWGRRLDALLDLTRIALDHLDDTYTTGADRYLVHLVHHPQTGATETLDGTPLHPDTNLCDTSTVTHTLGHDGETLHLGRKTRDWADRIKTQRNAEPSPYATGNTAGSPDAPTASSTSTTSGNGKQAAPPTSRTAPPCAAPTTGSSTTSTTPSPAPPTAHSPSTGPTTPPSTPPTPANATGNSPHEPGIPQGGRLGLHSGWYLLPSPRDRGDRVHGRGQDDGRAPRGRRFGAAIRGQRRRAGGAPGPGGPRGVRHPRRGVLP